MTNNEFKNYILSVPFAFTLLLNLLGIQKKDFYYSNFWFGS